MDLQSLAVADSGMNNGNAGGTYPFLYMAKIEGLVGLTVAAAPATPDAIPVIDFTGLSTTLFAVNKIEITEQSGKVTDELIGETDGKSFSHTAAFHVPGSSAKNLGLAAATKNARVVLFMIEEDGKIRVVGNEVNPARFESYTQDTGGTREEKKGGSYTFKSFGNTPAPILDGATVATLEALAVAP